MLDFAPAHHSGEFVPEVSFFNEIHSRSEIAPNINCKKLARVARCKSWPSKLINVDRGTVQSPPIKILPVKIPFQVLKRTKAPQVKSPPGHKLTLLCLSYSVDAAIDIFLCQTFKRQ